MLQLELFTTCDMKTGRNDVATPLLYQRVKTIRSPQHPSEPGNALKSNCSQSVIPMRLHFQFNSRQLPSSGRIGAIIRRGREILLWADLSDINPGVLASSQSPDLQKAPGEKLRRRFG